MFSALNVWSGMAVPVVLAIRVLAKGRVGFKPLRLGRLCLVRIETGFGINAQAIPHPVNEIEVTVAVDRIDKWLIGEALVP